MKHKKNNFINFNKKNNNSNKNIKIDIYEKQNESLSSKKTSYYIKKQIDNITKTKIKMMQIFVLIYFFSNIIM